MNLEQLLNLKFADIEYTATPRDAMLYALGVGVGDRPEDARDLQFVYEQNLKMFPSQVNVMCHPGGWIMNPVLEVDWVKLLHGEQAFEILKPLKPGATYTGRFKITGVLDKGTGKGALVFMRKELREKGNDDIVSTVDSTYFLRGDGGCGGTLTEAPVPHAIPDRPADSNVSIAILPRAALIYRLSGDYNPLHADPAVARKAGFERPILHGLCSLGVATRAILQAACNDQPEKLQSLKLRFSSPVYPGETLVTEVWRDANVVSFRSRVAERDVVVLNNGRATVSSS